MKMAICLMANSICYNRIIYRLLVPSTNGFALRAYLPFPNYGREQEPSPDYIIISVNNFCIKMPLRNGDQAPKNVLSDFQLSFSALILRSTSMLFSFERCSRFRNFLHLHESNFRPSQHALFF